MRRIIRRKRKKIKVNDVYKTTVNNKVRVTVILSPAIVMIPETSRIANNNENLILK